MIRVNEQSDIGKYTVLFLNTTVPKIRFTKIKIDGKEYCPEIVYDMNDAIAVKEKGNYVGKEIEFI